MTEKQKNLLFIAIILALAAVLWLAAHHGGTGRTAVLRYGDPQVEQRIDLRKNAEYDIDTGLYTIHLRVENGGIAFVDSPCPDHLCEGFGTLKNEGDWAACMPATASLTIA
uniref:NusG domain II-containing protein n=1 Tax=Gemmiger formicilis TaxID=745368 RepID=UPI0040251754